MIQTHTILNVADNTGATKVMCIRILNCGSRPYAKIGDIIIGVIKQCLPNMSVYRSEIVRAIIVRTQYCIGRSNGIFIRFDENALVLINKDGSPRGTRLFGPIAKELREQDNMRIVSLAPEVI